MQKIRQAFLHSVGLMVDQIDMVGLVKAFKYVVTLFMSTHRSPRVILAERAILSKQLPEVMRDILSLHLFFLNPADTGSARE